MKSVVDTSFKLQYFIIHCFGLDNCVFFFVRVRVLLQVAFNGSKCVRVLLDDILPTKIMCAVYSISATLFIS